MVARESPILDHYINKLSGDIVEKLLWSAYCDAAKKSSQYTYLKRLITSNQRDKSA